MTEIDEPGKPDEALTNEMLEIWDRAIRASHDFFSNCNAAIRAKKPRVREDLQRLILICARRDGELEGFAAIEEEELKMLYVHPDRQGQGTGRSLVEYAKRKYRIRYVDVYAQNEQAVAFYKHMNFVCYERTSKPNVDGDPLAVLRMRLEE